MMPAVLLHMAQDPAGTAPLGPLASGALAGGAGIAGGAAAAFALLRRRLAMRFAAIAVSALALMAIAPSIFPYDHVFVTAEDEHRAFHGSHCHNTPGSCADAPVTAGPGQILSTEPLLPVAPLVATLLILAVPLLYGITSRPEVRPPMHVTRGPLATT